MKRIAGRIGFPSWGRGLVGLSVAAAVAAGALVPASASAEFGIAAFDGSTEASQTGEAYAQAGGHPYQIVTDIGFNSHLNAGFVPGPFPDSDVKNALTEIPQGLMANPQALDRCAAVQLAVMAEGTADPSPNELCPASSQVGWIELRLADFLGRFPLFNMAPPTGITARFGFAVPGATTVAIDGGVRGQGTGMHLFLDSRNISQALPLVAVKPVFWGVPGAPSHDGDRCWLYGGQEASPRLCEDQDRVTSDFRDDPQSVGNKLIPFLTMPTRCTAVGEGLRYDLAIDSWSDPGAFSHGNYFTHDPPGLPTPGPQRGTEECGVISSDPKIELRPTGRSAQSPTGLDVELNVPTDGLLNPDGIAQAHLRKVLVTFPEGMSLNPSQGEGLGVCRPADLERESATSAPNEGCPATSKLGTVSVETPLIDHPLPGAIYLAQPDDVRTSAPGQENPFDSLVALYIVVQDRASGISIKLPGKVVGDPSTGRITSTFDNLPQVAFSKFTLHFREGARSPLVSPPSCGTYKTNAEFTPWSNSGETISSSSSFEVTSGIGGGPCPTGGTPPFAPKLDAGALNNNAGSFSPFYVRMFRTDADQEITNFSADLPPGVAGVLKGIPKCSDAQLAQMAQQTGVEAQTSPACPAASQVGRALTGFGVGSVLTYAPGKVYLAGPYRGTPVSIATVAPATVGPFDLGTVVVRSAFRVDPETAQVHIDSKGSDPIPHILRGFPLHLRDIRVYMDRPNFTFNPTSCDPMKVGAFLSGSGANFASAFDDPIVDVTNPFQAANCSLLPFKPKLSFKLKGGTKRGQFPALRAVVRARPGDANFAAATVTLPRTEFIEQGHIRTVCTRPQFAANECPAGSIYGHAIAYTPLLDEPVKGPVFLRSNGGERLLPDLVAALRGEISVDAVGFIDSVDGQVRSRFQSIPDTPVTKFVLNMQGGSKGLLVNHLNLCKAKARAKARFVGQNGKVSNLRPKMETSCKGGGKGKGQKRSGRRFE